MKYLLDTNILSETIRPKPERRVTAWLESLPQDHLYLSVLTLGEIRRGIGKLQEGRKRRKLVHWLETELVTWFQSRLVPIDAEIAAKWGHITAIVKRPLPAVDSLIAASALTHNLTLVTRNLSDFKDIPALDILNPWEM